MHVVPDVARGDATVAAVAELCARFLPVKRCFSASTLAAAGGYGGILSQGSVKPFFRQVIDIDAVHQLLHTN